MKEPSSRRQFLRGAFGILGSGIAVRIAKFFPEAQAVFAQEGSQSITPAQPLAQLVEGELYADFLLLPEGAALPDFVTPPRLGIPIVCSVGIGGPAPTAISESLHTAEELASEVDIPIYTFNPVPEGLQPVGASLIRHETGELYMVTIGFQSYQEETNEWETTVHFSGYPDVPKPFPLWESTPVEPGGPAIILEKVDFLPSPGILVATQRGHVLHWIENGVFYMLVVEHTTSRDAIQPFVDSLTLLN
jgi:hypothetical protein